MSVVSVAAIGAHEGQTVELRGWIYNRRSSGKIAFLQVRDGTGVVQVVVSKRDIDPELFEQVRRLGQESSLKVTGVVHADPRSPGGYEIKATGVEVVHEVEGYPITPKDHGPAFLHDHRHLWLRSRRQQAILRIRHLCAKAIRDYFDSRGYLLMDSPVFTPNACEGTTTLFGTEYFGRTAYLTQSGQLYQEAGAMAFGKTYCFGPTFRAEKSATRRHLTEFWMVEPEVAWADLEDVISLCEDFLVEVVGQVVEHGREHLEILERDISVLENVQKPFPRLSYDQACARLEELGVPVDPDDDFGSPHETTLTQQYDRPLIVDRFPTAIKAFYMKPDPLNPLRCLGVDVLAPEGYGEVIGGGQREDDLDVLLARIDEHQLPQESFEWFLDLRRYGTVPHGGFGLGLERLVCWVCGIRHIRETIPFPRTMDRLTP
ncbi:MAG: asparagine--tRNA ligase [Myxococcota bacterium]|jgi:asparaginyl-tRNA synthetase|nr:asparagine--tRNA ligase [Myxococcota bacterium]